MVDAHGGVGRWSMRTVGHRLLGQCGRMIEAHTGGRWLVRRVYGI